MSQDTAKLCKALTNKSILHLEKYKPSTIQRMMRKVDTGGRSEQNCAFQAPREDPQGTPKYEKIYKISSQEKTVTETRYMFKLEYVFLFEKWLPQSIRLLK